MQGNFKMKNMEAAVAPPLNPVQLHLLKVFSHTKSEESLNEIKELLLKYYRTKADEEIAKVWKEKNMSNQTMHDLKNAHYRTPYQ